MRENREAVRPNYDVFLNYRGRDTRWGFTDHLYNALVDAKFSVFRDDWDLIGEPIGPGLSKAIENSKIAILIISKRFGGSKWCLYELTLIMRRHAEQGLLVFPIFYQIGVLDVRHQDPTTDFGKAFKERAKGQPPKVVEDWMEALRSVSMIKGWTYVDNRKQAVMVTEVVKKVWSELKMPWIEQFCMLGKKSNCQVFLTSSPAIKKGLASRLSDGLMHKSISVFSDDDQCLIGLCLYHEIRNAMDRCKIFIPIISQDFASSCDCLDNLAQMVKCKKRNGSKILPIFYKLNRSRKQEIWDQFLMDMKKHKVPEGKNTYKQWEESLYLVWSISGWVSENIDNGDERKLVEMVVEKVLALLKNLNPHSKL